LERRKEKINAECAESAEYAEKKEGAISENHPGEAVGCGGIGVPSDRAEGRPLQAVGSSVANLGAGAAPEILGCVAEGVPENVGAPDVDCVAEGAMVIGEVGVGDAGGDGVADGIGSIVTGGGAEQPCPLVQVFRGSNLGRPSAVHCQRGYIFRNGNSEA